MPVLKHRAWVEIVPYIVEVFHQLMVGFFRLKLFFHFGKAGRFEHIYHQNRMVCGQASTAFGDDIGVLYAIFVRSINKRIHAIVDIFLYGIVDRTLAVWGACSVIIHAQTTATIHKSHIITHLVEVDIELSCFAKRCLNAADFGDLATNVEVNELQTIVHSHIVELLKCL